MNYQFYLQIVSELKFFSIKIIEEQYSLLASFTNAFWTPTKVQEIIDGVEGSKDEDFDHKYVWANEDVYVLSFEHGVAFYDLMADRAGIKRDKQDLDLTHDEFIQFLQDFKKFVEENS